MKQFGDVDFSLRKGSARLKLIVTVGELGLNFKFNVTKYLKICKKKEEKVDVDLSLRKGIARFKLIVTVGELGWDLGMIGSASKLINYFQKLNISSFFFIFFFIFLYDFYIFCDRW